MTTFKEKLTVRLFQYKYENYNNHDGNKLCTIDEVVEDLIQIFDKALTELIVEERVNRRGICTKTIRKIREQILYVKEDDDSEKVSPEPPN